MRALTRESIARIAWARAYVVAVPLLTCVFRHSVGVRLHYGQPCEHLDDIVMAITWLIPRLRVRSPIPLPIGALATPTNIGSAHYRDLLAIVPAPSSS